MQVPVVLFQCISPYAVNLDTLLVQLRKEVSSRWYQFGQVVGIEKETLDEFAKKCSPEDCLVETLDYWLRHHKGQPEWREVAESLRAINLISLANDIEMVHSTGKFIHHATGIYSYQAWFHIAIQCERSRS